MVEDKSQQIQTPKELRRAEIYMITDTNVTTPTPGQSLIPPYCVANPLPLHFRRSDTPDPRAVEQPMSIPELTSPRNDTVRVINLDLNRWM